MQSSGNWFRAYGLTPVLLPKWERAALDHALAEWRWRSCHLGNAAAAHERHNAIVDAPIGYTY